jgi:pyruvate/2-oxoglutarate dehydrogenase complex dihydrolipoamide dehydrogenase (E3) component
MPAPQTDQFAPDGTLPIDAPLALQNPDNVRWNLECDVLVTGFGAAGGAAALAAHEQGVSVMVVERFEGGGATTKSGGVVYLVGGTAAMVVETAGKAAQFLVDRGTSAAEWGMIIGGSIILLAALFESRKARFVKQRLDAAQLGAQRYFADWR